MKLNRTGSNWNRLERNKINENWDIIEGSYNDVVGQITDEVVGHLIDSAKLIWKEPVDTVEDLPANAEIGETRMVREADPDGISYVYRYDGEKWEKIQEIDVTLVNEVDNRLSAQLAQKVTYEMHHANANANFLYNGLAWADGDYTIPSGDDTQLLQSILDSGLENISFPIGKRFLISSSLKVDVSKVRKIEGNGATIVANGDFNVLEIVGSLTGTASPDVSGDVVFPEFGTVIDGLRITSTDEKSSVGIHIKNTFGLVITNCSLFFLRRGIVFDDINRNVNINNNHIYACENNGIHFATDGNIHQINIVSNHISYCRHAIYSSDHHIYNMQIVGNDIEASSYPSETVNCIYIGTFSTTVESVEIVGNTFEDHWRMNEIIKLNGTTNRKITQVVFTGNVIGNSNGYDLHLSFVNGMAISGNTFKKSMKPSLLFDTRVENVSVTGNTFNGIAMLEGDAVLIGVNFSNNTGIMRSYHNRSYVNPIKLGNGLDGITDLYNVVFSNNTITMPNLNWDNLTGYLVDIQPRQQTQNFVFKNNLIRAREYCDKGIRIGLSEFNNALIIKDNMVYGMGESEKYSLPATQTGVLVNDNI